MKNALLFPAIAAIICFSFTQRVSAQGKDVALETIGALSGATVYNTYIAIGAVADEYADKGYDADQVNELMDEQIGLMENLVTQMHDLQTSGFITDKADDTYIEEYITVIGYLRDEAQGLKDVLSGEETDLYEKSRKKAWEGITELLDLEDEK